MPTQTLKTYKQLQDEAELLGIKQNQSAEKLVAAIAEMTSVGRVAEIINFNKEREDQAAGRIKELTENLAEVNEINSKLGDAGGRPADVNEILEPAVELLDAQLADKEVYTDPYKTGLANGLRMAIAAVNNVSLAEEDLIKPVTQTAIKGAKVLTGRQRQIKEASKYITIRRGVPNLRSGLTPDQIKEADEIMKRLGVKEGTYRIPAE